MDPARPWPIDTKVKPSQQKLRILGLLGLLILLGTLSFFPESASEGFLLCTPSPGGVDRAVDDAGEQKKTMNTGVFLASETSQMFAVETGQMSAAETGQMSPAETGQMSPADTGQMSTDDTNVLCFKNKHLSFLETQW